jgi:hypothetical protein
MSAKRECVALRRFSGAPSNISPDDNVVHMRRLVQGDFNEELGKTDYRKQRLTSFELPKHGASCRIPPPHVKMTEYWLVACPVHYQEVDLRERQSLQGPPVRLHSIHQLAHTYATVTIPSRPFSWLSPNLFSYILLVAEARGATSRYSGRAWLAPPQTARSRRPIVTVRAHLRTAPRVVTNTASRSSAALRTGHKHGCARWPIGQQQQRLCTP